MNTVKYNFTLAILGFKNREFKNAAHHYLAGRSSDSTGTIGTTVMILEFLHWAAMSD